VNIERKRLSFNYLLQRILTLQSIQVLLFPLLEATKQHRRRMF
jgi:hypothetical protein